MNKDEVIVSETPFVNLWINGRSIVSAVIDTELEQPVYFNSEFLAEYLIGEEPVPLWRTGTIVVGDTITTYEYQEMKLKSIKVIASRKDYDIPNIRVTIVKDFHKVFGKYGGYPAIVSSSSFDGLILRLPTEMKSALTQTEKKTLQSSLDELRRLIVDSSEFEAEHRQRLLNRLEALQKEIHKELSDIEKFWSFLGDAGSELGRFGEKVKPLTDRLAEMAKAIRGVEKKSLPESSKPDKPKLPNIE